MMRDRVKRHRATTGGCPYEDVIRNLARPEATRRHVVANPTHWVQVAARGPCGAPLR